MHKFCLSSLAWQAAAGVFRATDRLICRMAGERVGGINVPPMFSGLGPGESCSRQGRRTSAAIRGAILRVPPILFAAVLFRFVLMIERTLHGHMTSQCKELHMMQDLILEIASKTGL